MVGGWWLVVGGQRGMRSVRSTFEVWGISRKRLGDRHQVSDFRGFGCHPERRTVGSKSKDPVMFRRGTTNNQ